MFEDSDRYMFYPKYNHRAKLLPELVDKEQREFEGKILADRSENTLLFLAADVECEICNGEHFPIIAGFCDTNLKFYQFVGSNYIRKMLNCVSK